MRAIFVLVLGFAAVIAAPSNSERIVGGIETSVNQYPYMTVLLYAIDTSVYVFFCGGSILNTRSILSAAHCTEGIAPARLRLRVGSSYAHSGGVIYTVESIFNHADHNRPYLDHDVTVIRTVSTIIYTDVIQPAVIAGANYILPDNDVVWAVGWGRTAHQGSPSEELRHTQIWTINRELCAQRYLSIGYGVTVNMFCSGWLDMGGRGQCNGDSGSPVVHNGVVVGITAWSYECALGRYPTVNMLTSRYIDFILAYANESRLISRIE